MSSVLKGFFEFPVEMFECIFSFLELKELKSLLLVSTFFSRVILETNMLRERILEVHPKFDVISYENEKREDVHHWGILFTKLSQPRKYSSKDTMDRKRQIPRHCLSDMGVLHPPEGENYDDSDIEKVTYVLRQTAVTDLLILLNPKSRKMFFKMGENLENVERVDGIEEGSFISNYYPKRGEYRLRSGRKRTIVGDLYWKRDNVFDMNVQYSQDCHFFRGRGSGHLHSNKHKKMEADKWIRNIIVEDDKIDFEKNNLRMEIKKFVDHEYSQRMKNEIFAELKNVVCEREEDLGSITKFEEYVNSLDEFVKSFYRKEENGLRNFLVEFL